MELTFVILLIAQTIFSVIAIILHGLGLYLLHRPNPIEVNQKLYLGNMSILEILMILFQNITIYLDTFNRNPVFQEYALWILFAVGFSWNNVLIMLTFDRFLQVYLNIKYTLYITERRTRCIIFSCYLIGIYFGLTLVLVNVLLHIGFWIARSCFYPMYGSLVVIMFAVTYLYIYKEIRKMSHRVQSTNHRINRQRRGIFIPFWIILTYISSILIPGIAFAFAFDTLNSIRYMSYIWRFFWIVGFIADALIYTLFNEPIKKIFLRLINRKKVFLRNKCRVFVVRYSLCSNDIR